MNKNKIFPKKIIIMETKKQNNADIKRVQSELLKYLRNETNSIPHSLKLLTNIDLSNSSLVELKGGIFNGFDSLHEINISNNQLTSLPHNLFDGLKNIDFINFSNNHIRELPSNLFSSIKTLVRINFSHNNIESLPDNLFNGLSKLDSVNFSYNSLKTLPGNLFNRSKSDATSSSIDTIHLINFAHNEMVCLPDTLFNGLKSLFTVNFSTNKIHSLPANLFKDIPMVWEINFSYNQIEAIPNNFFKGISSCKSIHISNNQLRSFPSYVFNEIKTLKDVSISNNNIMSISLSLLKNEGLYIDVRNNFITNDVKHLFKAIFTVDSSTERAEKSIIRKENVKNLNEIMLVLYLNKKCDETSQFAEDFRAKLDKFNSSRWSLLDFLISCKGMNEFVLIDLLLSKKKLLKENSYLKNQEFKLFSPESVENLCEINNLDLLKLALPVRSVDDSENPDDLNIFITNEEFYFEIDLCRCMEIAIDKNNEKIAMYLLNILNQIFELSRTNNKRKISLAEFKYTNVREFKENLLEVYLPKFFNELNYFNAIELILEICTARNFIEFLKHDDEKSVEQVEIKQNQITQDPSKSENLELPLKYEKPKFQTVKAKSHSIENELLVLIQNSNRANLLKHNTTKELLRLKWKRLPRFSYYLTLLTYITFTVFYSITIELYKNDMTETQQASIYICVILLIVFICLEVFQVVHSFIGRKLILYCSIFKNFVEIVNYPLCLITIFLSFSEAKSVLYSITIILSYVILVTRLDKFYEIGPYVTVFGNVIVRSLRLLTILLICLIGFLLSFRNRGNYDFGSDSSVANSMQVYNASFSLTLFRIFTFTAGQVATDDMGLDEFNANNFINYFIYGLFIIIMPILFLNVFTGISIDEISTLIERSEAENIATKIEYVYKFESIKCFGGKFLSLM